MDSRRVAPILNSADHLPMRRIQEPGLGGLAFWDRAGMDVRGLTTEYPEKVAIVSQAGHQTDSKSALLQGWLFSQADNGAGNRQIRFHLESLMIAHDSILQASCSPACAFARPVDAQIPISFSSGMCEAI